MNVLMQQTKAAEKKLESLPEDERRIYLKMSGEYKGAASGAIISHLLDRKVSDDSSSASGTTNHRQPSASSICRCSMNVRLSLRKAALSRQALGPQTQFSICRALETTVLED
jgi:hypothetical protein